MSSSWRNDRATLRRRLRLLDRIAKRFCIFPDAVVPGDDRCQRRWLAEQLRRRKMNGVERSNGFDGKRPADPCQDGICDAHEVATTFKPSQCLYRRALLLCRQSSGDAGPKDGSSGFREG